MKGKRPAKRSKVLEELHLNLEYDVQEVVLDYKRRRRSPDEALKSIFGIIYIQITEILQSQFHRLIKWVVTQKDTKVQAFKSYNREQIRQCADIDELFELLEITGAWLNTDRLMDVISASSRPARDSAKHCMRFYHAIVTDVCREVFLIKLPEVFHEQLRAIKPSPFRSSITVTYKKELKDFNLTELLENREYLHRLLDIPLCCFECLEVKSTRSTTVYWEVDATYTAHTILDVRQGQIFWSLMEQGIIEFHIEGSTHLSLRGWHIAGLIKNALLKGQNLIKLTQVQMFLACHTYVESIVYMYITAVILILFRPSASNSMQYLHWM